MSWDNIPSELKRMKHWVCWQMGIRKGKPTKLPYVAATGGLASSTDAKTWCDFDDAVIGAQRYGMDGIGFMFGGSGIVGVDVDHCRDAQSGVMTPEVQHIIETLDSYTEYSQSGEGLHILCRGQLPEGRRRKGTVEMYDTGRYFVMTGNLLDDGHGAIVDRQEQLNQIFLQYVHEEKKEQPPKARGVEPVSLDDSELIRKAMAAKNGQIFTRLWAGDITGHQSHSEADLALCNFLAFWTGRDIDRMITLWRQSGLWREKCDEMHGERTYAAITAYKAAGDTTDTYSPSPVKLRRCEVQPPPGGWPDEMARAAGASNVHRTSELVPVQQTRAASTSPFDSIETKVKECEILDTTHDIGRARLFSNRIRGWVLWCDGFKAWMIWTGTIWSRDDTQTIVRFAKFVAEEFFDAAMSYHGRIRTKDSEEVLKKASVARYDRAIRAMLNLAQTELAVKADEFDSDPFLLNCETGIIDLRTGNQLQHSPDFKMTKMAHAGYSSGNQWRMFGAFLDLITCGHDDLKKYFQDICGMAAIGKVLHEGMCICHGNGKNGKSTFWNCISKVLGSYAGTINPEALMSQRDGRQQAGGMSVMGKRLVVAQETEEGRKLSPQALKKLSSTDLITERPLYENERTFIPSHTLILSTNFLPRIGSTDDGTWRRIMVVPFQAKIAATAQIKDYTDKLYQADRDAILAWIVEGAKRYIANEYKFAIPQAVDTSTKIYQNAEDWMGNFLDECCLLGDFSVPASDLYEAYCRWCESNNEHPRRTRDFSPALEARGFRKRKTIRCAMWDGLEINKNYTVQSVHANQYGG